MSTKILFLLGVAIVLVGGVALFFRGSKGPGPVGDSSGLIVGNNTIYVAEQGPGYRVSASLVRLEKSGFVVIHEDTSGAPGKILGVSSLLPPGETRNSPPITLLRSTTDGETIYAMLHLDDGDGTFDIANDKPAVDSAGGTPVMMVVGVSQNAVEPGAVSL